LGTTPTDRDAILRPEHRYSEWLKANWSRDEVRQGSNPWPNEWDAESTFKYWRGMTTGNWSGAAAEQRAAMAEGTSSTGGYLVPAPVAGNAIDLLRDALVFTRGMSHTVPWDMPGNTMSVPVVATDVAVSNLAEGVDLYPPPSDITINRYMLTARPYAALETWSWELEEDSAVDVNQLVMHSFIQRIARSVQSDFLYGNGANTIQGVFYASGLNKLVEGGTANGQMPASATGYDYVDKAIQTNRTAKLDADMIVTSPLAYQTYGRLKNTLNDAIRPSPTVQSYIDGRGGASGKGRFYQTTAIKDNQTVGTATADCSDMFVLSSDMIYFGIKHDMSVLPLRERFATARQAGAIAWMRLDAVVAHAEAQSLLQVKTS
jgi:HK97 family phage major capsid protein